MSNIDARKLESQLQKLIEDEAPPTRILTAAERLLAAQPNNLVGLQCKVVCCLLREKFGSAIALLDQIQDVNPRISTTSPVFVFRKAYCHYRLRQYTDAKLILRSAGGIVQQHIPCRHLQAQVHYNLEEYKEAAQLYQAILKDGAYRDEQEKIEILTNLSAAYSACEPPKAVETVVQADDKTYDMCYNAATALIAAGDMPAAQKMLVQAEMLCAADHPSSSIRSLFQLMGLPEGEAVIKMGPSAAATAERKFFNDVASVWVQMAYVWDVLGEEGKASNALHLVLSLKPNSVATNTVAATNWAAMKGHRDFFDVSRKLKLALNPNTLDRLTSKQLLSLRYNSALLQLLSGSMNNCRRELEHLRRDFPDHYLTHSLTLGLMAVESLKKKKPLSLEECESAAKRVEDAFLKSGDSSLGNSSAAHPSSSPDAFLTTKAILAQVFLQQGDLQRAAEYLMADTSALRRSPSAISTIASWKVQVGDVSGAVSYLKDEISKMEPCVASKVLCWAVHYLATVRGLYAETGAMLQSLWTTLQWMRSTPEMAALRCFVLTFTDVEAARAAVPQTSQTASPSPSTVKKLSAGQPTRQQLEQLGYRRSTVDLGGKKPRRARRRRTMRRPPKSMEGKIDPERWIPMNLRSYIVNLPERRKRELRRLRAIEQDRLRRVAEKRKAEAGDSCTK